MKNLKMLFSTLLLTAVLSVSAQKKVAVVTFYADRQVDLTDVGMQAATIVTDLANGPTFNLQPILKQYHDEFFNNYAKKFPFTLVPENEVTSNPAYQQFKPDFTASFTASSYTALDGYQPVPHFVGKNNIKELVKIFGDVDGIMFVYVTFRLNKGFGVGGTATTKMQAYTNIALFDKKGEKVFTINEHANSSKTGVMVGGVPVMKPDKILPMCESALTELMEDLGKRIGKIVEKSKKL